MQGSNSERRMTGTSRYTRSYIGNGVAVSHFQRTLMPANRVQTAYRRWRTGRKLSYLKRCSEAIWPQHMKLQPDAERRGCTGKTKMKNEEKNMRQIERKREKEKTERWGMQKAGEPYGAGANILLRWPYAVRIFDRTVTVLGYSFSLEVLAAGLRAGRICLRTLLVFPASGFKELQLITEAFLVMSISSTPPKTLMLIYINRSTIMVSSFG